jgi:hypothetical protein
MDSARIAKGIRKSGSFVDMLLQNFSECGNGGDFGTFFSDEDFGKISDQKKNRHTYDVVLIESSGIARAFFVRFLRGVFHRTDTLFHALEHHIRYMFSCCPNGLFQHYS